jgi:hypothetical protein
MAGGDAPRAADWARAWLVLAAAICQSTARGQDSAPPLDPIQRAVVDSLEASLALPAGETPAALLDAAIKASGVDALEAAERYLARLATLADKAGADAPDMLADLADAEGEPPLVRLARAVGVRQPAAGTLVRAIIDAGRMRRRDPGLLAKATADLASESAATRQAAADRLARAGIDSLPVLVPLLDPTAAVEPRQRDLAHGLVKRLGPAARQPLLDWLGTSPPEDWAGVIEALAASDAESIERFLLAPALVPGTPPAAAGAARRLLDDRARGRGLPARPPSRDAATAMLSSHLDQLLTPAGLPVVDHLSIEPIGAAAGAVAAFGGDVNGTVERRFWNPQAKAFQRVEVSPRVARAREAMHLARDLQALGATDPAAVDLILLARLETLLVTGGDPLTVLERVPPAKVREALAGPEGFTVETAGRVFEQAVERGMWQAAAAATSPLLPEGEAVVTAPSGTAGTLPPAVREALAKALGVPDATLQFASARALALAAGEPPYRGSSRVVETLMFAATATGRDRAVVAHPDLSVGHELAAGVSRHGYEPVVVRSGRQAIFAARGSADTVLVILSARLGTPTALETTQFLQQQGLGDTPPVMVVVDPLDDDGRGKYLTRLLLAFADLDRVAIVDRLESLFEPVLDPETGKETLPARFPDLLALAAGPAAVDPATRNTAAEVRLVRAREALGLLARLGRRGWDVSPAQETAELALLNQQLYGAAASLLASMGRAGAQAALEREAHRGDLPEPARLVAKSAFEASLERWGILLESGQMLAAYGRYNHAADDTARRAAGDILDVLEAAGRKNTISPADAAPIRPRR